MHVNVLFITDIFLLCALRTPWANYTAACPEKAWHVPMSRSGENTAYIGSAVLFFTCKCHVFFNGVHLQNTCYNYKIFKLKESTTIII